MVAPSTSPVKPPSRRQRERDDPGRGERAGRDRNCTGRACAERGEAGGRNDEERGPGPGAGEQRRRDAVLARVRDEAGHGRDDRSRGTPHARQQRDVGRT